MRKKVFIVFTSLLFVSIPFFGNAGYIVKKNLSIHQIEPKEKNIELVEKKFIYKVEKKLLIKQDVSSEHISINTLELEKTQEDEISIFLTEDTKTKIYSIFFVDNGKVLINNSDTYLLSEKSYDKLYEDLICDNSIKSALNFLSCCHYFYLDSDLQELPFDFYGMNYEIINGLFKITSPDSDMVLSHSVIYEYDADGNIMIISKCDNNNFIGLGYLIVTKSSSKKEKIVNAEVSFFEKWYYKGEVLLNYDEKAITTIAIRNHSYFTDICRKSYSTILN